MKPRHQVSRNGIELIKRFEGYRPRAARLDDGRWTIGYGHLRSAREGAEVSEADAEALLRFDLEAVVATLNEVVFTPLTQHQFDALTAFAFSIGLEAFRRSNVLRRVNEGNLLEAASAIESWRRAEWEGEPIVVDALIRRRAAEKALFLTPPGGFIAAPSAVLKPELDYGALGLRRGPSHAAEIVTPLDGDDVAPARLDSPETEPTPSFDEPSPALEAAEKVSRRLQALFADEPNVAPPVPDDRPPELPADPALSASAREDAAAAAESRPDAPEAERASRKVVVLESPAPSADAAFDQRIARTADENAGPPYTPAPKEEESRWPYVWLALGSLAIFVFGVSIVINARRAGETALFGPMSGLGSALALLGVAGVCSAVYFWLELFGRDREGGDGEG